MDVLTAKRPKRQAVELPLLSQSRQGDMACQCLYVRKHVLPTGRAHIEPPSKQGPRAAPLAELYARACWSLAVQAGMHKQDS